MTTQFLNQSQIDEMVEVVLSHFEFNLTSRSPISEVTWTAIEVLMDHGHPPRRSLAIIIAKKAKARFVGQIQSTKNKLQ